MRTKKKFIKNMGKLLMQEMERENKDIAKIERIKRVIKIRNSYE